MMDDERTQGADMSALLGLGQTAGTPRNRRWWIAGGAVVAAIVIFASVRFAMGPAGPAFREAAVTQGGLIATVNATGTLQPVNTVDIGPEISGQIDKVLVDFNDRVTAGQVLAVMDTDVLSARVAQSRANLTAARARVADAKATVGEATLRLGRIRELFSRGNSSKQELDSAEATAGRATAAVGSAEAQVLVAAATLSSDETSLSKTEIRSPINGIVLSRTVEPGQVVAASFQTPVLFKLAEDLSKMQLEVDVDEADIGHVQEKQQSTFTVDAFPDRQFPATITQVRFAPKTKDNVVTYQAVLAVDNAELLLRPGMTATATITTATRADATLVPNAALRFTPPVGPERPRTFIGGPPSDFGNAPATPPAAKAGSTQKVWIKNGRTPQAVEVKVGISDGNFTEITSGALKPGDRVIVGIEQPPKP
jgi:HlyD family secretion protein